MHGGNPAFSRSRRRLPWRMKATVVMMLVLEAIATPTRHCNLALTLDIHCQPHHIHLQLIIIIERMAPSRGIAFPDDHNHNNNNDDDNNDASGSTTRDEGGGNRRYLQWPTTTTTTTGRTTTATAALVQEIMIMRRTVRHPLNVDDDDDDDDRKKSQRLLDDEEHPQQQQQEHDHQRQPLHVEVGPDDGSTGSNWMNSNNNNVNHSNNNHRAATIAACFLADYEASRPPTLSPNLNSITNRQLWLYNIKYSIWWRIFGLLLGSSVLFICHLPNRLWVLLLHMYSIVVFMTDLYMKEHLLDREHWTERRSWIETILIRSMVIFLICLFLQSWVGYLFDVDDNNIRSVHYNTNNNDENDDNNNNNNNNRSNNSEHDHHWTVLVYLPFLTVSLFKPIVFFYESRQARDAIEALGLTVRKVVRVIFIELFLILIFATIACRLYNDDENFHTLSRSWLSLFACTYNKIH